MVTGRIALCQRRRQPHRPNRLLYRIVPYKSHPGKRTEPAMQILLVQCIFFPSTELQVATHASVKVACKLLCFLLGLIGKPGRQDAVRRSPAPAAVLLCEIARTLARTRSLHVWVETRWPHARGKESFGSVDVIG
jgi:hypothetical protein